MTSNKIPEASAIQQEMRQDLRWFETLLYRDVSWRYRDAGESWKYRSKACVQETRSRDLKIEKPENGDDLLVRENLGVDWKGDSFPYWDFEMWLLCYRSVVPLSCMGQTVGRQCFAHRRVRQEKQGNTEIFLPGKEGQNFLERTGLVVLECNWEISIFKLQTPFPSLHSEGSRTHLANASYSSHFTQ